MILSHAHKFIYIKTYKTGSTSVEAALSGVCGPDDVLTEASEQLRDVRQKPAQNYRIEHPAKPKRPYWKTLLGRPERPLTSPRRQRSLFLSGYALISSRLLLVLSR